MTLLVDRRELTLYPNLPTGGYSVEDLGNYGDAAWFAEGPDPNNPPYCGMERKRLDNLLNDIENNHLVEQLRCMIQRPYQVIWLVIESEMRPNPDTGVLEKKTKKKGKNGRWHYPWVPVAENRTSRKSRSSRRMWDSVYKWVSSVRRQMFYIGIDMNVWVTRDAKESARWLWSQYTLDQKPWKSHRSFKVFNESQKFTQSCAECGHGPQSHRNGKCVTCKGSCEYVSKHPGVVTPPLVAEVASRADKVGWDRALAIADHFASVRQMVNADVKEYLKIEGVGKETAASIVHQWNFERKIRR